MAPPSAPAKAKPVAIDLSPLDGLRGISSIVIAIGHYFMAWAPRIDSGKYFPAFAPEYFSAVTLFFVISGFTLVQVYDRHSEDPSSSVPLSSWTQRKVFFLRRVVRLAPIYYLGLLFGVGPLVAYLDYGKIMMHLPTNLIPLQSLMIEANEWNGPLWTISAFVFCYLFFPKCVQWYRPLSYSQLRNRALGLTLLSMVIMTLVYRAEPELMIVVHMFGPIRVMHFVIGVIGGYMAKRAKEAPSATRTAEVLTIIYAFLMGFTIFLGAYYNYHTWMRFSNALGFFMPYFHVAWLIALTSPKCGGVTKPFLSSKPLKFLGDISYAVYCLHYPMFNWCAWIVEWNGVNELAVPRYERLETKSVLHSPQFYYYFDSWDIIPILAAILVVSTISHRILEAPARVALYKQE